MKSERGIIEEIPTIQKKRYILYIYTYNIKILILSDGQIKKRIHWTKKILNNIKINIIKERRQNNFAGTEFNKLQQTRNKKTKRIVRK